MQSNNHRETVATGGGPNFKINGKDADAGDVKNVLSALLGRHKQTLDLQNLDLLDDMFANIDQSGPTV